MATDRHGHQIVGTHRNHLAKGIVAGYDRIPGSVLPHGHLAGCEKAQAHCYELTQFPLEMMCRLI